MDDITGKRYGRLVAVKFVEYRQFTRQRKACWLFKCDCGNEKIMPAVSVKFGRVRSCGCLATEQITSLNKLDITGQTFSRLTAVKPTDKRDESGSIIWECKCSCGNTCYYSVNRLTQGRTQSCGCYYDETRKTLINYRKDVKEDTLLSTLVTSKTKRNDNTSGHTGVYFDKRSGKWFAMITFQKKKHYLGYYKEKEDAIKARERAEEEYFDPFIEENWDRLTEHSKEKFKKAK